MRDLIYRLFSPTVLAIAVLLALIVYTVAQQRAVQMPTAPQVSDGKMVVGADHSSRIELKGNWRFYWQELLTPEQLHDDYGLLWVPARWNSPESGLPLPGNGFATYALDIYFEQPPRNLGLQLPMLYRAAKVWANGAPLVQVGRPAANPAEEIPRDEIKLVRLPEGIGHHLQLVVQVSSFHHVDGGIHKPFVIDNWDVLVTAEKWRTVRGIFLMSSTLTLAIYLLVMWGNAHAGREYLYLGLGLFWYAVRIFGTEKLIYYLFPGFSAQWLLRAEYYGMFLCIPAYMLFIQALYPRDINYWVMRAFWWVGAAASIITTVVDARWYTMLRDPFEALCVVYIVYFIGCLIMITWRRRPWSGLVSFLGGVIALLFVNEVLYYREVTAIHLTPWVYIFVALTSIIFLGQRLNELLSIESEQKAVLQKAVDDRTFELQRRLEELDQARRHALELAQKRSEFMAELSHEIRTPLAGLVGAMRLMGRKGECDKTLAGHAVDAGESLLAVVNESLSASGSRSVRASRNERFDMAGLLRSVVTIMAVAATEKKLALEFNMDERLEAGLWVDSNPLKIRQILSNLLNNAIKFTDAGVVYINTRVTAPTGAGRVEVCIEIADTGIGIDASQLEAIFDEYVQLDTGSQVVGNGLGLAICRKLVRELGGTIEVCSNLGDGATFRLVLPLQVVDERRDGAQLQPNYTTEAALHVLVVEDDRVNRTIVVELIGAEGHQVRATHHPVEALKLLQQEHFDLCLFDIRLPDMSGLELLERARNLPAAEATLFVALTANTSESDIAQYRTAGFDFVMEKPVNKSHLQLVLSRSESGPEPTDTFFLHSDLIEGEGALLVDRRLWQGIVNDLGAPRSEALLEDAYGSLREYAEELEAALGRGNFPDIRHFAHKMKSAAKSVGMISVANIAHHVEASPERAFSALGNLNNLIETSYQQMRQGA
ncbi:ATP-binding protein [Gilvimarinus sp. SDUM040013]|uniref:histidine kinase n=1 Tax=Gilvimarinus gilvus TaxID=3058038 RepID=A0ABU4S3G5_9GAMM|nr:ATP-binding protein [Gilvimarinus sp. SDUM040013]MDO3385338.1 ATP-binding protein [Gilvimarinus sp. SDUM040013]MDX6851479.1 ATP-binding protein [Gilvimarinus sp. SDUM040013]